MNTAVIKYRNLATTELNEKNYSRAYGACYAINAVLPKKYQIRISTEEYEEVMRTSVIVICGNCDKEINRRDIEIAEVTLSTIQSLITNQVVEQIWVCLSCGHNNRLDTTRMKQTKLTQPHFKQVVPEPPKRRDGLNSRMGHHNKAEQWVWLILEELEYALATYREDYTKEHKDEFEENTRDDDLA